MALPVSSVSSVFLVLLLVVASAGGLDPDVGALAVRQVDLQAVAQVADPGVHTACLTVINGIAYHRIWYIDYRLALKLAGGWGVVLHV